MVSEAVVQALKQYVPEENICLQEPMAGHTTFRIGGPADCLVELESEEQLIRVQNYLNKVELPYFILGNGSNLLVSDEGYRGVVLRIGSGMNREFTAEAWKNILPMKDWYEAVTEANDLIEDQIDMDIQGYDIDGEIIKNARQNAIDAGVDHLIHLQQRPVNALRHPKKYGFVITNPPYGERLEEKAALPELYTEIGEAFRRLDSWSYFVLTSYDQAEKYIGRKADKNRKIYNGMIKTYLYEFMGPRPPKRKKQEV